MGDLGRRDEKGRIWFFGRKSHRVQTANGTLFTIACEGIFNVHPMIARTALVGVGPPDKTKPIVCFEPKRGIKPEQLRKIPDELQALAKTNPITSEIETFLLHPAFPVDIRHNAKIFREKLAVWAARQLS
jgi:acyl-coenzyme A synthetase/AMP-(fatty) acid ligase